MKQHSLQEQIDQHLRELANLHQRLHSFALQQQQCAEREDYDNASKFDHSIRKVKRMCAELEQQVEALRQEQHVHEQRKCRKQEELLEAIQASLSKLTELHSQKQSAIDQFEESNNSDLLKSKKQLHYEKIRLTEDA